MDDRTRLKTALRAARAKISRGDLSGARLALEAVAEDPALAVLGDITALGVPRKLQSVLLALAKAGADPLARIGYQYHLVPPPGLLDGLARTDGIGRKALAEASRQAVPHVLHQIWIGPKPPPAATTAWAAHAAAHGMDYRLWRETDLAAEALDDHPVYTEMLARRDYPGAVDVARYLVLRDHGGIYVDCDFYPARSDISFADRLPLIGLTAMAEPVPRLTGSGSLLLANSFIAAPPKHPAMARLVEALPTALDLLPGAPAWWVTGPLLFTAVARSGAVSVADAGLVVGHLPADATAEALETARAEAERHDKGLLLAWKPW